MHRSDSLTWTTAHKAPGAFLKALLVHLGSEERRQLLDRLAKAEHEETAIRRAVFLMVVLLMLSVAGLGYCAILLPEVFATPTHPLMRTLSVLGLGSLISQAAFLGYLFWHRTVVTRLHEECRRLILALAQSQIGGPATPGPAVPVAAPVLIEPRGDPPSAIAVSTADSPGSVGWRDHSNTCLS